ncbi:MAG: hypothetical protein ACSHYA_09895 [Opitutaceae bacterium]
MQYTKTKALYPLLAAILFCLAQPIELAAKASPWTIANRIAISADGNPGADADDVGATPFTLAVLAKLGLQGNLVHYDFNNFLDFHRIDPGQNRLWLSAMGGQARWGFDAQRFFDGAIDPEGAIASLIREINQSTAEDPLYLVAAGPMELTYRALEGSDSSAHQHVIILSHHNYNEYHKARPWQRNWNDIQKLAPEIGYLRIVDQNGWGGNGLKAKSDEAFNWLRDHEDPNLNWVYERIVAGKPDVSDAGMLTWLVGLNAENEMVTVEAMRDWFGADPIPMNGGTSKTPAEPKGVDPTVVPPQPEQVFQEVDGRLVIEAEAVPLTESWVIESEESGYSGAGYLRWMPEPLDSISHKHQGVLLYKLRITNPGTYRMALKSSQKGAPKHDLWNSCSTLMGNDISPWGTVRNTHLAITKEQFEQGIGFSWETIHQNYGVLKQREGETSVPIYELEAGDHYFWIFGRHGGFKLDKIHFFKEGVRGFQDDSIEATPILAGDL